MDWRAAGGIGQALNGYAEGVLARRDKDRQESIQDEQLARIRQSWDESQQRQAGMDLNGAQKAYRMADPAHLATAQLAEYEASLNGPAPVPAPANGPTLAAPAVPGLGAPTTGLVHPDSPLAKKIAQWQPPAPAAAPALTATPPQAQPQGPVAPPEMSDTLKGLHEKELAYTKEAQEAETRIIQYARQHFPNDPQAANRMLSAWMDMKEKDPSFQKWKTEVEDYKASVDNAVRNRKAQAFVDAVRRKDQNTINSIYGPGWKVGQDPRTGLDGLQNPDGTWVGMSQVLTDGMLKAGLIDANDYTKQTKDNADNMTKLMVEMMKEKGDWERLRFKEKGENWRASLRMGEDSNKDIQVADEIQKTTLALAKEADPAKRDALQAKLDSLQAKVTRANAYVKSEGEKAVDRLERRKQQRVNTLINQAKGDAMKGVSALSPLQAVAQFKKLANEDPDMALAYALNLNDPDQGKAVMTALDQWEKDKVQRPENSRDAGTPKGGRPEPSSGGERQQFRDKATGDLVWFRLKGNNWVKE
jgi:hypothetical protein